MIRLNEEHYKTFAITTQLNENFIFKKKAFLNWFSFVCFLTFVVQNLPARGRKTEKNKEMALLTIAERVHITETNDWVSRMTALQTKESRPRLFTTCFWKLYCFVVNIPFLSVFESSTRGSFTKKIVVKWICMNIITSNQWDVYIFIG
jgi:hypothetical protein